MMTVKGCFEVSETLEKSAGRVLSSYFFITLRETDWEYISLSDILNNSSISYHIDCQ